jgi:uncharacterized protein (DUF58 family)
MAKFDLSNITKNIWLSIIVSLIIILLSIGMFGLILALIGWMLLTGLNMSTLTSIDVGWTEALGAGLAVAALNVFSIAIHFEKDEKDEEGNK